MADPLLLLYRADWTQWSLSAKVIRRSNQRLFAQLTGRVAADMRRRSGGVINVMGSFLSATKQDQEDRAADGWSQTNERLLLAPGGRYRFEPDNGHDDEDKVRLIVSDGESCWVVRRDEADQSVADLAHPPFAGIAAPTWLMSQLQFATAATTEVAGRSAIEVRGTPRLPASRWGLFTARLDRVDIVIDAGLGLVLRYESVFDGQPLTSLEVADLVINPSAAADPARFRPDDGVEIEADGVGPARSHRYWRGEDIEPDSSIDKRRMALNLARGAVYLAAKQLARPEQPGDQDDDTEAAMPASEPPVLGPAPATPGSRRPVSDALLHLITHTDMAPLALTAQVHHWLDGALAWRAAPTLPHGDTHEEQGAGGFLGTEEDGIFGLHDSHRTARLTLSMPDRYRIDFEREDRPRHPLTIACDGERLRKLYHNRVVESPPLPLPTDFVRLVDPAWLLRGWPLSEAGEQTVDGRRAIRLIADVPMVRANRWSSSSDHAALMALAIDAELGVVLQQVSYLDNKPVNRYELRHLQPCEAIDVAEFGPGIGPDLPVIHTGGEPIGDLDLPPSARAAGQAGANLVNGTRSAFGWLANRAHKVSGG